MYRAKVIDIDTKGRIRVLCPPLYGEGLSGWISPAVGTDGPVLAATVWLALENNDPQLPIWLPFVGTV